MGVRKREMGRRKKAEGDRCLKTERKISELVRAVTT
jgi:hypothetical protein